VNGKHPIWLMLAAAVAGEAAMGVVALAAAEPTGGVVVDDEVVVGPIAAENAPQIQHFGQVEFDQWMFQNVGNAKQGEQQIRTRAQLQLAELDRLCELSEPQRQKLELAAKGDIERFFQEVDVLRRKFNAVKGDQQAMMQMWQEISPLHMKQARGLTGPGSLMAKTLSGTLSADQTAHYEEVTRERRRFRYEASIAIALHTIEATIALKDQQREAIKAALLEFPPPLAFGQYDHYLVMYRLAGLPPEKLQPHLDARQWEVLKRQFNQYRRMGETLFAQGYLEREELGRTAGEAADEAGGRPAAEAQP
jgi:hypothetical protein